LDKEITMDYKTHRLKSYPWGYELPITIILDDKSIHEELILFDKSPDEKQLSMAIQERIAKLSVPEPEPDEMISKNGVEQTLREKGYLTEEQKWEDLMTKEVRR